jgi:hypothetical protein
MKIWAALAAKGVRASALENECRDRFCNGHGEFDEYASLIEVKLSHIPEDP